MGGRHLVHDCGVSRSIGYFLEPLIVLGMFGKKPLTIRLKGMPFTLFYPPGSNLLIYIREIITI